jgi:peptide chain release factor 3
MVHSARDTIETLPHDPAFETQIARRRTFAIISHPDAGKTTLTEKLLLYAGAVHAAGSVRPKKNRGHATSDWMAIEQQRGISITSTVLQFEYEGCLFNLLDTPGHQDFSEDTYRTLTAVDSAVMVLDSAKGIEPQTRKLFEACRLRKLPILTFINKMDHHGRDPLELLDEIEKVLGIAPCPINWPVGSGNRFRGVIDLATRRLLQFDHGASHLKSASWTHSLDDTALENLAGSEDAAHLRETLALLQETVSGFDEEHFLRAEQTPVFFGSALNNFGVEPFLEALVKLAPPPAARLSHDTPVPPNSDGFSAFVFKIQGNMDPNHRDSMAILRVCSGRFERDMLVNHPRLGRKIRMTRLHRLFARDRETIEEAFPGDVVGVVNPGLFTIGDTLSTNETIEYERMPSFPPEHFCTLHNDDMSRNKQFRKGIQQLSEEGVVQVYYSIDAMRRDPILAAVGQLQFDVVEARFLQEYAVRTRTSSLPYVAARWPDAPLEEVRKLKNMGSSTVLARDSHERIVLLFNSAWNMQQVIESNPTVQFRLTG